MATPISIFWFRRDLRLEDNVGLFYAHLKNIPVFPIFIFDTEILEKFSKNDKKIAMIYDFVAKLSEKIESKNGKLHIYLGKPKEIFEHLRKKYQIHHLFLNHDYEPYAIKRDSEIKLFCSKNNIGFHSFKDQVIFEKDDVLKNDGKPYIIFTPYKKKWIRNFQEQNDLEIHEIERFHFAKEETNSFPFERLGFVKRDYFLKPFQLDIPHYQLERDYPALNSTSNLSIYLRFGLVSIRKIMSEILSNSVLFSELIWREFFMQIVYHYPRVETTNFRVKYDNIKWINSKHDFDRWKNGETGYPIVDAGMRELNKTGYMHNRVRMIVASFLTKHLLIDWRWGEAYFAEKLLDYELASNNGNWQWAASTGCDAVPYFRIFNPIRQQQRFDPDLRYIKKWCSEENLNVSEIVDHKFARERAIETYKNCNDSS